MRYESVDTRPYIVVTEDAVRKALSSGRLQVLLNTTIWAF